MDNINRVDKQLRSAPTNQARGGFLELNDICEKRDAEGATILKSNNHVNSYSGLVVTQNTKTPGLTAGFGRFLCLARMRHPLAPKG